MEQQEDLLDSQEFHCSLCTRLFSDPRLLKCGHTFCSQCLKNHLTMLKDKSKISCHVCKGIHKFDKGGVDSLSKNVYVENLLTKLQEQKKKKEENIPLIYSLYSGFTSPNNPVSQNTNTNANINNNPVSTYPTLYEEPLIQLPIQQPQSSQLQSQTQPLLYEMEPYPPTTNYNNNSQNDYSPYQNQTPSAPPIELNSDPAYNTQQPTLYPNLSNPNLPNPTLQAYNYPIPQVSQNQQVQQPQVQSTSVPPPLPPKESSNPPTKQSQSQPPQQPQSQSQSQPKEKEKEKEKGKSMFSSMWSFITGDGTGDKGKQVTQPTSPPIPIYYAPFATDVPGVYPHFKKWCSKWWFAPSDFDNKMKIGSCVPSYIPFWVFTLVVNTSYEAHASFYDKDPTTGRKVERWAIQTGGQVGNYPKIIVCGDMEYRNEILEFIHTVDDWNTDQATSTQPFLCGAMQPKISKAINQKTALTRVSQIVIKKEEENCVARLKKEGADRVEQFKVLSMDFTGVSIKLIYLPLFASNYFYEGKEYKFIMNAQTNDIKGQRPYGLGKLGSVVSSGTQILNSFFK